MIPCTLRQLEIFLAAAEDCHFMRTANRFGISQAAISTHIAALENQLGKRLFIRRRGTKPVLSSYGLAFLGDARTFFAEANKISGFRLRDGSEDLKRRIVRLCAGGHLLDDCIKRRLSRFHDREANFDIECHYVEAPARGAQLVKDGRMDLLVYTVANPAHYSLHAEILRSVRFGLYASAVFSSRRDASPAEISKLPFILPTEGSEACRMVQTALLETGIICRNVAARAQFAEVMKDLAKQGKGVVALYETMITPDDVDDLVKLDVELPTMYRTLFRMNRVPNTAVQSVEDFLREALAC